MDTVTGFAAIDDVIQLENAVFTALAITGVLAAGAFNTGAAATQADDRIIYNSATGALLYDADGLGVAAGIQFAALTGAPVISAADFVVI
jgi:serralysin